MHTGTPFKVTSLFLFFKEVQRVSSPEGTSRSRSMKTAFSLFEPGL
jgi:hypothetical protein